MPRIELSLINGKFADFDRSIFNEAIAVTGRHKRYTKAKTIVKLNYESEYGDMTILLVKETKEEIENMLAEADKIEIMEKTNEQMHTG